MHSYRLERNSGAEVWVQHRFRSCHRARNGLGVYSLAVPRVNFLVYCPFQRSMIALSEHGSYQHYRGKANPASYLSSIIGFDVVSGCQSTVLRLVSNALLERLCLTGLMYSISSNIITVHGVTKHLLPSYE